jgi:hypothetical protein
MIDDNLKQEWLEKVKVQNRQNITSEKSFMAYSVNTALYSAPEEVQKDYDVNLQAALVGDEFLWNIDKECRSNKEFINTLIANDYPRKIYEFLQGDLKHDRDIFMACVVRKDDFRWGLSTRIIENRDLIVEAMKVHDIYDHVKTHYHLDKEIVGLHLQHNPDALPSLKKSMKNYFTSPKRKEFIIDLLKKVKGETCRVYDELPDSMKENLEVIDAFLVNSSYNCRYLPDSLRNDKAFMLYAIEKYGVNDIGQELKADREVVKAIVSKNGIDLSKFKNFASDVEMLEIAVKTYNKIDLVPDSALYQKEVVKKFLEANPENSKRLLARTDIYNEDYDIMKLCVEYDGNLLKHSRNLKDNKELADLALAATGDFDLISTENIKNRNIVLQLLNNNKANCKKALGNKNFLSLYKNDVEIAKKIIMEDPTHISYFPSFRSDKDFVNFAISLGLTDIKVIDPSLYADKELAIKFSDLSLSNYEMLPLSLKNDYDVALAALKAPYYYNRIVAVSDLEEDIEFTVKAIKKNPVLYKELNPVMDLQSNPNVIVAYIESSKANNKDISLPKAVYDFYGVTEPHEIKTIILQQQLEDSLAIKGTNGKKLKI